MTVSEFKEFLARRNVPDNAVIVIALGGHEYRLPKAIINTAYTNGKGHYEEDCGQEPGKGLTQINVIEFI